MLSLISCSLHIKMESQALVPRKLWEHRNPKSTLMWKFMQEINGKSNRNLQVRGSLVFSRG